MSEPDSPDCPLCMELLEIDDLHFYPCTCGYQICRFCWHRIKTDGNGLCPACRKTYTEDPAMYRPLSQDEIQKAKKERKQIETQRKQKITDTRQHLSDIRVIQKHLVFVVGLSKKMADIEVLKQHEYFGKYGKIVKIVINPNTNYAGPQGPSASAYITYTKVEDALKAILSINNMQPPLKIRASLGTTKYCTHYLRSMQCPKQDCMYLHDVGEEAASFTKEDMQAGKHQIFEKNLLENYAARVRQQQQIPNSSSKQYLEEENSEASSLDNWDAESADSSLLPSQASWGTSKEEHFDNCPKEIEKKNDQILKEKPVLKSSASNKLISSIKTTESSGESSKYVQSVGEQSGFHTTRAIIQQCDSLNPEFSTGWATSTETAPKEPVESATELLKNNVWPGMLDLGLSDLKVNSIDDELGFDPFRESTSGLEDLIAIEKQQALNAPPQPSFSWDAFWPSSFAPNLKNSSSGNSYSLFGNSQQQVLSRPSAQVIHSFQPPILSSSHSPARNPSPLRFMSPHQTQTQFYSSFPNMQQHNHEMMNQMRYPLLHLQSSNLGGQSQLNMPPLANIPTENKNWQDGFRALFPNINISFGNSINNESDKMSNMPNIVPVSSNFVHATPPNAQSWNTNNTRLPPPPGFSATNPPFQVLPQAASSLLNTSPVQVSAIQNINSNLVAGPTSRPFNIVAVPSQSEDPSILWSKLLTDENKEVNVDNMAFPLPGENTNQSSGNALPQQNQQGMASWNIVVSGNQPQKVKQDDMKNLPSQPLQISAKESCNTEPVKLQKSSPIFGNQVKPVAKKPTAHVKPLKSSILSDGFTTVSGSRQPSLGQQLSVYVNPSSRVSELDDFTNDFPTISNNGSINLGDYTSIGFQSKQLNKKKKKKGKDGSELVSTVLVGRVETETNDLTDDEPLKKSVKNKKKVKNSPPSIRKSPLTVQKIKNTTKSQPIRILKSDAGTTSTILHSPTQVIADQNGVNCKSSSSSQEQEIVSRLTESTEKLLKNVLFETEAIKLNTEQISKDLKSALEKCKESSLSLSDLEKINLLLSSGKNASCGFDDDLQDTTILEKQVESARREAKMLEARLNEVIRKNMASELETLKRNTKQ
ncbi:uncharacterized protein LOC100204596 isoform X2 [Hydra vulgaris]|uniref:Uncharacterized protein LOC100204596 isoform X2 n=1 Tax=Hydra vulgaris TaxID=6087 RepID=A0ABM4BXY7_HYDVU